MNIVEDEKRTRKRLGRPPLPAGDVRSKRIVTYLTEEEMTQMHVIAKRQGVSLSMACYRLLRQSLVEAPRPSTYLSDVEPEQPQASNV